jgi:hypothetical protein
LNCAESRSNWGTTSAPAAPRIAASIEPIAVHRHR